MTETENMARSWARMGEAEVTAVSLRNLNARADPERVKERN